MVDFILANGYRNAKFAKFNSLQKFPPKRYIVCLTDRVDSTKQLHSTESTCKCDNIGIEVQTLNVNHNH